MPTPKYKIGVLASGEGATFQAVQSAIDIEELPDTAIAFVVTNESPAPSGLWRHAHRLGIDIYPVSNKVQTTRRLQLTPHADAISYEASETLLGLGEDYNIDMFVGLGFTKRIIGRAIEEIPFVKVHPGPLPATAGKQGDDVQREVLRQGLDASGPTFHWMMSEIGANGVAQYDQGAPIAHQPVAVTTDMRRQWETTASVELLSDEVMRVERLHVPSWIYQALEQL